MKDNEILIDKYADAELLQTIYENCHTFLDRDDLFVNVENKELLCPIEDINNFNSYDVISIRKDLKLIDTKAEQLGYKPSVFNISRFIVCYVIVDYKDGTKFGELNFIAIHNFNAPKVAEHFEKVYFNLSMEYMRKQLDIANKTRKIWGDDLWKFGHYLLMEI